MKRFLAILLSAVLLLGLIPMIKTMAASENVSVSVTADKTTVNPGDEITFTISLNQIGNLAAIEMGLDIPSGLTYVANSGALDSELRDKLNTSESLTFTESSKKIVWADPVNYWTSTDTLKIATFKCTVNADTDFIIYSVGLNEVQFCDEDFEIRTHNINNATISVVAPDVLATGVTLNKNALSLTTGTSETLSATVTPNNATNQTVKWTSSDSSVATVDSNGTVEALKRGTTTITVTTDEGGFIATCTVTVACSHSNTTTHSANESTCLVQGNGEYVTCDDCGELISGSDAKLPLSGHKGGAATCEDKAVCTVCSQAYGEYANHILTCHNAVSANHTQGGNIEYWTCDVCGKFFSDAAGVNEIIEADTKTNKIPHSYSIMYSYNGAQHWYECECGDRIEVAEHKFDNSCDVDCNTCGYTRSVTHDYSVTWSLDGTNHWHECIVCQDKTDITTHSGGTATCTAQAKCAECNAYYGEMLAHDSVEIIDEKYLKSEATCTSKAVYYKSCSVCGEPTTETIEMGESDNTNHTNEIEIKDAVAATCTTDGYSGDIYCKGCGEKLEDGKTISAGHDYGMTYKNDAENHWKECGCGDAIEKSAHTLSEWTVIKEASTTEKGSKERTCSVCGYKEVEELPVLAVVSPKTGDYNNLYLWIALLAISCLGVVEVVARKKRI